MRRVYLDLTGLPPTQEELDAALSGALYGYPGLVERLLASPRYGERMAWDWLEWSRYADTDGYQADPTRQSWPWRDWLVQAFNDNQPFDELTVALLAGDLLPNATPEQVLASAFNRHHPTNGEGGRIFEETRVENVFDRLETTATVWMGLTMECARCHDHKYDPISQTEYYGLFDFFNQTSDTGRGSGGRERPTLAYLLPEQRMRVAELQAEQRALAERSRAPDPELDALQVAWEEELRQRLPRTRGSPSRWRGARGASAVPSRPSAGTPPGASRTPTAPRSSWTSRPWTARRRASPRSPGSRAGTSSRACRTGRSSSCRRTSARCT